MGLCGCGLMGFWLSIDLQSFFGVYDDHGGVKASEFVPENLHKNVLEMTKDCKEKGDKEEALKDANLKTDRDFLAEVTNNNP